MSQIDVYVSQSFMDDPRARWLALQEFRLEFRTRNSGREPRIFLGGGMPYG